MKRIQRQLFLIIFFFFSIHLIALEERPGENCGTVIVTYQTDQKGQRLDRIRFWLVNQNQERSLYPKKDEFVDNNHNCLERTVVIGNLPAGRYKLLFLAPNSDHFFEDISPREFEVQAGCVLKIDQEIKLHDRAPSSLHETDMAMLPGIETKPFLDAIALPSPFPFGNPSFPIPAIPIQLANFSLKINQLAEWKLINHGQLIYASRHSISNLPIPAGLNYYLIAKELPGYALAIYPKGYFDASPGQSIKAEIFYQHEAGYIDLESVFPSDEGFSMMIRSRNESIPPIQVHLIPSDGTINWYSGPLPTGEYAAFYTLPSSFAPPPPQRFIIANGRHTMLAPQFNHKGSIQVTTDTPEAAFTLSRENGPILDEGKGNSYLFSDLTPGYYILRFSSPDQKFFVPPHSQRIAVSYNERSQARGVYQKSGQLTIASNIDSYKVTIQAMGSKKDVYQEEITNRSRSILLPEGRYSIVYEPLANDTTRLKPIEVYIRADSPQNVYLAYDTSPKQTEQPLREKSRQPQSGLLVKSNLTDASFTVKDLDKPSKKPLAFKGKSVFVPIETAGKFQVTFHDIPNYLSPSPIQVVRQTANDYQLIQATYESGDQFTFVPAGKAIIGDPFTDNEQNERPAKTLDIPAFSIGTYEVTNLQFANWLTKAFQEHKISWLSNQPGRLVNQEGLLICKTIEANPLSQIVAQTASNGSAFYPMPGKENYPVIEVTWHGANAYCRDQGYRLPTENEWEKAAGMSLPTTDAAPRRFKYGFGQDTIDRRWANYRNSAFSSGSLQVLTTPVGFYNGKNTLSLQAQDRTQVVTHEARSPAGAYDMSGNVWEWVASWDSLDPSDTKKISKGGCYDSLADGVRVSERLALSLDYSDIYTGFRAAKNNNAKED